MRPVKRIIALATVLLFAAAAPIEAPALPSPPQQAAPWTPPETKLPRFLVEAAQTLFDQGLADPRGCAYRSIRVRAGDDAAVPVEIATTGWALPAADGGEPRHAVAWNGLVYPLVALGEPADLDTDVRALIKRPFRPNREGFTGFEAIDEAASVALGSFRPTQVCLLLRLGRVDLAEALWAAAGLRLAPEPAVSGADLAPRHDDIAYLRIATVFAWARYNRAVCAHMRADDALALADARALDAFRRAVDAKAAAMGVSPPPEGSAPPSSPDTSRYIRFLGQAPALLADQERRARERANPPPPAPEGDKVTPLIRALDQIGAEQSGYFKRSGLLFGSLDQLAPIRDLIALGDDAVEPLIQALRSDDRLTRCVVFQGRGGLRQQRTLLRVDEAACAALTKILKVSFGRLNPVARGGESVDRGELADRFQTYWDNIKDVPTVERWYRTLANDQADARAWLDAAENIVRPEGDDDPAASRVAKELLEKVFPAAEGAKRRLRGEPLRRNHAPTVSELLSRRIELILKGGVGDSGLGVYQSRLMAGHLASWDPAAAAPVTRDLTRLYRERYALASTKKWNPSYAETLAAAIGGLTRVRAENGDKAALREYAEWIKTTSFESFERIVQTGLSPFWTYPDDPDLAAAADWLFNDPQSPWASLASQKGAKAAPRVGGLISSPLIRVPAFRKLVRTLLADRSVIGEAEYAEVGLVNVEFDGGPGWRLTTDKNPNDPDAPPIGAKTPLRACDLYARLLVNWTGAPYFNPCWPEPKRDAALAEFVEYLERQAP